MTRIEPLARKAGRAARRLASGHLAGRLVRFAVPVLLLAIVWTLADTGDALRRLGHIDWASVGLALIAAHLQIVLSAARWTLVARRLGLALGFRNALAEYYLSQLVNQTVPGGMVGDAARAVRTRTSADLPRAAQAVVIERMAGQVMLWSVIVVGLALSLAWPGGIVWPAPPPELAVLILGALLGLCGLGLTMVRGRIAVMRRFGHAVGRALLAPDVRWIQLALGVAIVVCNLAGFAFAARATATLMSLEVVLTLVPLILTAMLIPATVAGWGFREGAAAALFPLIPASSAAGLAASLVFGLVILAASLPGVFVLLRRRHAPVSGAEPTATSHQSTANS